MKIVLLIQCCIVVTCASAQQTGISHTLLKETKAAFVRQVKKECDSFPVHLNDSLAKSKIGFFNRDFQTQLFRKAQSVSYWYCLDRFADNRLLYFEVVSFYFTNQAEKNALVSKITASGRKILRNKVMVGFKIKEASNELAIIYSSSSLHPQIKAFFEAY